MPHKKGYRLTKQGTSFFKMGWKQVTSGTQGERMSSTMTMDVDTAVPTETNAVSVSPEHLLFRREVSPFFILHFVLESFIFIDALVSCMALKRNSPFDKSYTNCMT